MPRTRKPAVLAVLGAMVIAVAGGAAVSAQAIGLSLAASPAGGSPAANAAGDDSRPKPSDATEPTSVDPSVTLTPAVQAQIDYVTAHWKDYNTAEYGVVSGNDCVNFASQSLVARGWEQDDEWHHDDDNVYDSSAAWLSSTALRDWLETRPDLATHLDDTQRDQVQVGDIVQFDWDNSGDRDHTGIVTRVEHNAAGVQIFFAGHTEDSEFRSVDTAITVNHPGASVDYWHLAG